MQLEHTVAENGLFECWELDGNLHREDGPAFIGYDKKGNITRKVWYINGKRHREDGPCLIEYDTDGSIVREEWFINDKLHRENAPAYITYKNNKVSTENWYLNNQAHRLDDAAEIWYDDNLKVIKKKWFRWGREIFKEDFTSIEMIDQFNAHSLFSPIEIARLKKNAA